MTTQLPHGGTSDGSDDRTGAGGPRVGFSWSALGAPLWVWVPCGWLLLRSDAPLLSIWCWWALVALPAGVLASRAAWRFALLSPLGWWLAAPASTAAFPRAQAAAAACTALFALGYAVGLASAARGAGAWRVAGLLWLAAGLLCALPSGAGLLARPWPPGVSSSLLDLSPQVWVFEAGGFDWLRHPAVYERAGTADLDPGQRVPWRAGSAYLGLFAAAALVLAAERLARSRAGGRALAR